MSKALTKSEKKLVSMGRSQAGRKAREASRSARMVAVPVALGVAKLEASMGDMLPSFDLPGIGETKLSTIAGYGLCFAYMFSNSPGVGMTSAGLAGVALAARGQS